MRAAEAAVAGAEALAGAGAGAVTDGADAAEADALAATAAAFADAGEAEAAGAERVADLVAPHVAARAQRIVAERVVAAPGRGRRVGIAAGAGVEQADHAELGRVAERRLARDVRIRVVLRALHAVAVAGGLGVRVAHRALFALGARAGAALLVVGVVLGDLLGLLLLLLLLGGGLEVLLDQVLLIAIEIPSSSVTPSGGMKNAIAARSPTCTSEREARVEQRRRCRAGSARRRRARR